MQRVLQFPIVERLLHQRLASIEVAVDRYGVNVAAQSTEQLLLQRTDFALRIEDHHPDVFQAVEGVRHGGAGVAGGGGQNGHRLIAGHFRQHLRHKAAAEVFERQRRAVEQLQAGDIFGHFRHRRRELKSGLHAFLQRRFRYLFADKGRQNTAAAGDKVLLQQLVDLGQFELRQLQREEQPLLLAQALFDRLREADLLVVILKVVQFHALSQ